MLKAKASLMFGIRGVFLIYKNKTINFRYLGTYIGIII